MGKGRVSLVAFYSWTVCLSASCYMYNGIDSFSYTLR